ncbi:hypothetical protein B7P43_G05741 [Cryptotermes secundus]|uniref:Protein BANP n=2 Tax=Cryptotermes secundus TaxID=105785 RepID=A0A2J7QU10_9NEOP|nr:protein BANP [Cryptotermes secundus]XP_023709171.1 protein BANP [Cryptotermes secundus]XP_023709173.1 protein BANP [Cryptotermes secundus]PNF32055.1 hypothetical protein B7P43_G05741 [Cryptotermes secundus]
MSGVPLLKRARAESTTVLSAIEACSKEVSNLKLVFNQRLGSIENHMDLITAGCNTIITRMDALENFVQNYVKSDSFRHSCCEEVLQRMNTIEEMLKTTSLTQQISFKDETEVTNTEISSPIVLVRNHKPAQVSASLGLDSTLQVITLNNKTDFPEGSWLGDENNPEARVRCAITPSNLLHINTFCQTPEKMAVTLLDYLFPREVLAVSNLSGKGKHRKRQLDPLMIYGIRCHLLYKFNITERDWYRIKQNMDSKCRTAWKKKVRGLPLGGIKGSNQNDGSSHQLHQIISEDGESLIVAADSYVGDDSVEALEAQVIHTSQGDIKVLHATPEQLVRLQETHHIQVLSEDQILPVLHEQIMESEDTVVETADSLTLGCTDQTLTIVTSTGEVSVDVASIASDHRQLVETQDIHIEGAQVLQMEDSGDLGVVEARDRVMEAGEFTTLD